MPDNSDLDDNEQLIQEIKPSWKNYIGWMIIGLFMIAANGIGLIILLLVWLRMKYDLYTITTERIITKRGIIARRIDEMELYRIKDVIMTQGVFERMLGIGSVDIISVDFSTPKLRISGINNPVQTKEKIRKLYKNSRKKERVVNTEIMFSQQ